MTIVIMPDHTMQGHRCAFFGLHAFTAAGSRALQVAVDEVPKQWLPPYEGRSKAEPWEAASRQLSTASNSLAAARAPPRGNVQGLGQALTSSRLSNHSG